MAKVLSLDIETKNLSTDIGGWGNTHMFLVSTVATWDGSVAKIYVDTDITGEITKGDKEVLPLRQLKFDLDDHFKAGGSLLGHNIVAFDLPVLRDSLDIYCVRKYLKEERYIDTSRILLKSCGQRITLDNAVTNTIGDSKSLNSADAPLLWKQGEYDTVVDYCLKDTKLCYDLWKHGQEHGEVSAYTYDASDSDTYSLKHIPVEW
tara:strand:+ start:21991 stop:22605 length:615 start_codon:yes stop_codon:yes gene_type:complete